jgi:succinoglycan biosynthesis protein ExoL
LKIAYFVHDLADASVSRRAEMLHLGGARLALAGFRRSEKPVTKLAGLPVLDLGQTFDGALVHRTRQVMRHAARPDRFRETASGADVVLARNLEMLAIAAAARRAHAPHARLVYECLDVHRLMCGKSPAAAVLRALEEALLSACSGVLVSAPAFITEHFERRYRRLPRFHLVENKVLPRHGRTVRPSAGARPAGPPWRIGWFGNLRCRRSVEMLKQIAREAQGKIEVVIRGRPSTYFLPDFPASIANLPHIRYGGPYSQADLADLYGAVHFAWSVDYTEEGFNSDWLLPNRIYEGSFFNTPGIAERRKAAGRWLADKGAGIVVDDAIADTVRILCALGADDYRRLEERSHAIDTRALAFEPGACRELVAALR